MDSVLDVLIPKPDPKTLLADDAMFALPVNEGKADPNPGTVENEETASLVLCVNKEASLLITVFAVPKLNPAVATGLTSFDSMPPLLPS